MSQLVTSQSATGFARGKFDTVSFNVDIEGRGRSGPDAKAAVKKPLKALLDALSSLGESGVEFKSDEDQSSLNLSKETRWDEQQGRNIFTGYLASYSLHVESSDVDRASEIQDVLTSVDGIEVDSPTFTLEPEQRRELQKAALKLAVVVVKDRFKQECEVLSLDPEDFEINTFNTNYGQRRTNSCSNFAMKYESAMDSNSAGGAPVEIKSGLADVEITLTVSFKRK